jgi:hypothetical protein
VGVAVGVYVGVGDGVAVGEAVGVSVGVIVGVPTRYGGISPVPGTNACVAVGVVGSPVLRIPKYGVGVGEGCSKITDGRGVPIARVASFRGGVGYSSVGEAGCPSAIIGVVVADKVWSDINIPTSRVAVVRICACMAIAGAAEVEVMATDGTLPPLTSIATGAIATCGAEVKMILLKTKNASKILDIAEIIPNAGANRSIGRTPRVFALKV